MRPEVLMVAGASGWARVHLEVDCPGICAQSRPQQRMANAAHHLERAVKHGSRDAMVKSLVVEEDGSAAGRVRAGGS